MDMDMDMDIIVSESIRFKSRDEILVRVSVPTSQPPPTDLLPLEKHTLVKNDGNS